MKQTWWDRLPVIPTTLERMLAEENLSDYHTYATAAFCDAKTDSVPNAQAREIAVAAARAAKGKHISDYPPHGGRASRHAGKTTRRER